MADLRTETTELATGLGMLDFGNLDEAVEDRPPELVNVGSDQMDRLRGAVAEEALRSVALAAFDNGRAFRRSVDGLRGRPPVRIEWKGPHRPPGYDLLPADLRVDHVYLVSCKYQSKVLCNVSPAHLFDRLLQVRSGPAAADWYAVVAPEAYQALYAAVRGAVDVPLPASVAELGSDDRRELSRRCARRWPVDVEPAYREFCRAVSEATAQRWAAALPTLRRREELLWRLLRLADSPYFVLGSDQGRPLRLRIGTPWDWRQRFRLEAFTVAPSPAGQPQVLWEAWVHDLPGGDKRPLRGHVEIRWSHGRFSGMPEAKVYLDTPHAEVPGYFPLEPTGRTVDGDELLDDVMPEPGERSTHVLLEPVGRSTDNRLEPGEPAAHVPFEPDVPPAHAGERSWRSDYRPADDPSDRPPNDRPPNDRPAHDRPPNDRAVGNRPVDTGPAGQCGSSATAMPLWPTEGTP